MGPHDVHFHFSGRPRSSRATRTRGSHKIPSSFSHRLSTQRRKSNDKSHFTVYIDRVTVLCKLFLSFSPCFIGRPRPTGTMRAKRPCCEFCLEHLVWSLSVCVCAHTSACVCLILLNVVVSPATRVAKVEEETTSVLLKKENRESLVSQEHGWVTIAERIMHVRQTHGSVLTNISNAVPFPGSSGFSGSRWTVWT